MRTCSVVLTDRNDDYKDKDRAKYCISSFVDIFDEVWFVDWATDTKRKPLLHEISGCYPKIGKIRNVVISPEFAKSIVGVNESSVKIPDVLARNIAIRRSTTDFIVSSGIDIFGPEKLEFCKMLESLDEKTFYTISRRELEPERLYPWGIEKWRDALSYFSINSSERRYPGYCTPNDWYSIINCCGDFQIAHKDIWNLVKGFEEKMLYRCFSDSNIQKKVILNRLKVEALYTPPLFHIWHDQKDLDVSICKINDPMKWVEFFSKSENAENWGLSDRDIEVEII